ncbi:MAG: ATP synthase subunit I [Desulfomicrobium sp.]|jgi:F1F0 ATPase subunit 2|nr:ATP synthase subunit I [Desulfomicrobium sp.]NLV96469.1 ATP synthase subunit AtpR [Desulfovibrionales bacterium]
MIDLSMQALLVGALAGIPVSLLFFMGLDWGISRALSTAQPGLWLLVSFLLRSALLLGILLLLLRLEQPLGVLLGFALTFMLIRILVTRRAKRTPATQGVKHATNT